MNWNIVFRRAGALTLPKSARMTKARCTDSFQMEKLIITKLKNQENSWNLAETMVEFGSNMQKYILILPALFVLALAQLANGQTNVTLVYDIPEDPITTSCNGNIAVPGGPSYSVYLYTNHEARYVWDMGSNGTFVSGPCGFSTDIQESDSAYVRIISFRMSSVWLYRLHGIIHGDTIIHLSWEEWECITIPDVTLIYNEQALVTPCQGISPVPINALVCIYKRSAGSYSNRYFRVERLRQEGGLFSLNFNYYFNNNNWCNADQESLVVVIQEESLPVKWSYFLHGIYHDSMTVYLYREDWHCEEPSAISSPTPPENPTLKLSPNPTSGKCQIVGPMKPYKIYDLTGRLIYAGIDRQIPLEFCPNGIYFLMTRDSKPVKLVKI
jgi:hypothetical protein